MEAVAAASSIAGIASLAGQTLDGIIKLHGFFKDCASSSKTIDRFLRDLNSLIQTLEDVKSIIVSLERVTLESFDCKSILSSLQIQLEDCSKDVYGWVRIASEQHPRLATGSKATFKKFLVTANKDSIEGIFKEIASHKENLTLKLSIIGRSLDIEHASCLQAIHTKLNEVTSDANENHDITYDAIRRLEERLSTGGDDPSGTPSLRSLVSQVSSQISRIESIICSPNGSQRSYAGSARGSSIGSQRPPIQLRHAGSDAGSNVSSLGSRQQYRRERSFAVMKAEVLQATGRSSDMDHSHGQTKSTQAVEVEDYLGSAFHPYTEVSTSHAKVQPRQQKPPDNVAELALFQLQARTARTTDALLRSYRRLLDVSDSSCPKALLEYIDLVQFFRTVSMHTKLLCSLHEMEHGESIDTLRSTNEYLQVLIQLQSIKECIEKARQLCWKNGHNLEEVDQIIGAGYPPHKPARGLVKTSDVKAVQDGQAALFALQKRLERLKINRSWSRKQDRINSWLLQNLAESDEAASLHRSYLPDPQMNEEEWARKVLKFWPVDGAAVKGEKKTESSGGAVDSGRPCHSVRVLLEMMELEEMSQFTAALSASAFSDGFGITNRVLELERLGKSLNQPVLGSLQKSIYRQEVSGDDIELVA